MELGKCSIIICWSCAGLFLVYSLSLLNSNIYGTNRKWMCWNTSIGRGRSPFAAWFEDLDPAAEAKVTAAVTRLSLGNMSNVKGVGAGVIETKIAFGPGYLVYFGKDGESLVILLAGGTKRRQQQDIKAAQERWQDYKDRKKGNL